MVGIKHKAVLPCSYLIQQTVGSLKGDNTPFFFLKYTKQGSSSLLHTRCFSSQMSPFPALLFFLPLQSYEVRSLPITCVSPSLYSRKCFNGPFISHSQVTMATRNNPEQIMESDHCAFTQHLYLTDYQIFQIKVTSAWVSKFQVSIKQCFMYTYLTTLSNIERISFQIIVYLKLQIN